MRRSAVVTLVVAGLGCVPACGASKVVDLHGAGASFPAPLYDHWFKAYVAAHPNTRVDYQSNGSGAGVTQFTNKTIDFGASDAAMTDDEISKVDRGVQLLPVTAGSIVLAYNLPDLQAALRLSRAAYAAIFLGKVTKWNDRIIAEENPGVTLPDMHIAVVYRADSSGTSFVFTQHLSAISPEWQSGPGTSKSPNWPAGIGAKGNEGVTATILQTPGALGYVEYGYAKHTGLKMAQLQNKAGAYVEANTASSQEALQDTALPDNLRAFLPDPDGAGSYPIVTYTWLLLYRTNESPAKAEAIKDVVRYCLSDGQAVSESLGYVPLPSNVVAADLRALENVK